MRRAHGPVYSWVTMQRAKRTGAANGQRRCFAGCFSEGNRYVRSQGWRRPCLVQALVPCRLPVVVCARMRWELSEQKAAVQSSVFGLCSLQETRRASIQPSRCQLRRRYNFILLLCAILFNSANLSSTHTAYIPVCHYHSSHHHPSS